MSGLNLSDLAQTFQLRRDTVRIRSDLARATQELSSGRKADLGKSVSGNFGPLAGIDAQLSAIGAYTANSQEAALFADTAQLALERVRSISDELGAQLTTVRQSNVQAVERVVAAEAHAAFRVTVAALNTGVAGRSVFAGAATDGPALAPADEILAKLRTVVAAETTATGVEAALEAWFAPGGDFDTEAYRGSGDALSPFRVAEGRQVEMPIRADDSAFREQLKGLAMAALMNDTRIPDAAGVQHLAETAGKSILSNQDRVLSIQAEIGATQARIDAADTQNAAERTALRIARTDITSVDPYEVATELQNLETQLETIYTITARLSRLNLADFLR